MIDISPRVQRLIVRSFPYLPFKVVYKKGTDIPVADVLSHVTPMDPEDNIQLPIIAVNIITTWILMSVESQGSFSNKLDQLRKSTAQVEQLTRLKGYISTGFRNPRWRHTPNSSQAQSRSPHRQHSGSNRPTTPYPRNSSRNRSSSHGSETSPRCSVTIKDNYEDYRDKDYNNTDDYYDEDLN